MFLVFLGDLAARGAHDRHRRCSPRKVLGNNAQIATHTDTFSPGTTRCLLKMAQSCAAFKLFTEAGRRATLASPLEA